MADNIYPRIVAMAEDAHVTDDGGGAIFGFKLSDGKEQQFAVTTEQLGFVIEQLNLVASHVRKQAMAAGNSKALMKTINPDEQDQVNAVSVLAASDHSHFLIELTLLSGLTRKLKVSRGQAAQLVKGLSAGGRR